MNKIKNLFKNKTFKILMIILVLIISISFIIITFGHHSSYIMLETEYIELEYGNSISLQAIDYLDTDLIDNSIIDEISVTTDAVNDKTSSINEDGDKVLTEHDYPPVGKYTVTLSYKSETKYVSVNIIDTTAPEFEDIADTYQTTSQSKLKVSDFNAYDLSGVEIAINDDEVDYNTSGTYTADIIATDPYNNINEIQVTVINTVESVTNSDDASIATSKNSSSNESTETKSQDSSSISSSTSTQSSNTSTTSSSSKSDTEKDSSAAVSKNNSNTTTSSATNNTSSTSSDNNTNTASESTENTSTSNSDTTSPESWAMSESEMISYAKNYIQSIGFTWEDSFTKSNSGWNAPLYLKISMTDEEIKSEIKDCIDITARSCDPNQGGLKFYIEKESNKLYDIYVFY